MDERLELWSYHLRSHLANAGLAADEIDEVVLGAMAFLQVQVGEMARRLDTIERGLSLSPPYLDWPLGDPALFESRADDPPITPYPVPREPGHEAAFDPDSKPHVDF